MQPHSLKCRCMAPYMFLNAIIGLAIAAVQCDYTFFFEQSQQFWLELVKIEKKNSCRHGRGKKWHGAFRVKSTYFSLLLFSVHCALSPFPLPLPSEPGVRFSRTQFVYQDRFSEAWDAITLQIISGVTDLAPKAAGALLVLVIFYTAYRILQNLLRPFSQFDMAIYCFMLNCENGQWQG